MKDHLTRLARIVHALRQGQEVTSGPFTDETSRRKTTTQEWFFVNQWRISGDNELMHRTRVESGRGAAGDTTEPTDWSPQDLMQTSAYWNKEALEALPALPAPGVDFIADELMALADGDWHPVGPYRMRMIPVIDAPADEDCPWTFERKGEVTNANGRPFEYVLSDLVFIRR